MRLANARGLACLAVALVGVLGCAEEQPEESRDPARIEGNDRSEQHPVAAIPGRPKDLATVKKIQQRYGEQIFDAFDGVVGHGIGAAEPGSAPKPSEDAFIIVVYLEDSSGRPAEAHSLKGVPLRFTVTGEFRAY